MDHHHYMYIQCVWFKASPGQGGWPFQAAKYRKPQVLTFERQIGCPNQLRSAPGSDDVTLRHCCWETGFCAASPQCTQVLKWHAADHFDCGGPASTLAWASVSPIAYRRLRLAQLHGTLLWLDPASPLPLSFAAPRLPHGSGLGQSAF